ncbi:MAG: hypothetical protein QM754_12440 [Tepidisphaeraceae bacterium]
MHYEQFESRTLFAATATLNTSTHSLNIQGTSGADTIAVTLSGSNVKVQLNSTTSKSFAASSITAINVHMSTGNDKFTMTDAVKKAAAIFGEGGNDTLVGGGQNDYLDGGDNDDKLDGGAGDDQLKGGTGTDTADFSNRTYALNISLDGVANDGGTGGHDNVFTDVENVKGGSAGDTITGSSKNNKLEGNGGNDTIYGNSGNDTIYGGSGKDYLVGNTGKDVIYGGSDNDTLDGSDGTAANDILYGEGGTDDAYFDKSGTSKDTVYTAEHLFS